MSIGNTTLRVAQWIVIGIAALNIVFSIANGNAWVQYPTSYSMRSAVCF